MAELILSASWDGCPNLPKKQDVVTSFQLGLGLLKKKKSWLNRNPLFLNLRVSNNQGEIVPSYLKVFKWPYV